MDNDVMHTLNEFDLTGINIYYYFVIIEVS